MKPWTCGILADFKLDGIIVVPDRSIPTCNPGLETSVKIHRPRLHAPSYTKPLPVCQEGYGAIPLRIPPVPFKDRVKS